MQHQGSALASAPTMVRRTCFYAKFRHPPLIHNFYILTSVAFLLSSVFNVTSTVFCCFLLAVCCFLGGVVASAGFQASPSAFMSHEIGIKVFFGKIGASRLPQAGNARVLYQIAVHSVFPPVAGNALVWSSPPSPIPPDARA